MWSICRRFPGYRRRYREKPKETSDVLMKDFEALAILRAVVRYRGVIGEEINKSEESGVSEEIGKKHERTIPIIIH